MKTTSTNQSGFTAIELLITLLIAAMFLFAGYQLYTQVIRDGSGAEETARVSNIVYDKMRQKANVVSISPCAAVTTTTTEAVSGIGNVTYTTTVSCPYSGLSVSLVKVSAAFTQNGSPQTVDHASYAYASK